ncbi:hypothetical protein FGG08_004422 [Glutinoglossum americanum]|uniref:Major facilitator superfamily (MFS) profile domain-containing protein n=1 Tax=Glutinoglossum americanum TaxID=1670608 RepID=A0A9P8HWH5_9PEZI|nr:hypothetical protein FGG08_004422 [Glutinoglossum americanum]
MESSADAEIPQTPRLISVSVTQPKRLTVDLPAGFVARTFLGIEDKQDPNDLNAAAESKEEQWKPRRPEYLVMATLSFISLLVALDATVLIPALPVISHSLNGSAIETFWAGTSYLLASTVFQPTLSALSDIFGRRELLLVSISLFTLGTVVACVATNFTQLLAGRSVQGIGGGGIIAMVLVIFTDIVPLRQRPKYISFVQMAWALGTVSGPLAGGLIAENTTWRWIFYLNFPFCAIGLVVVSLVVKLEMARSSLKSKLLRVDWLGSAIFIPGMTSFLIAITWGGVQFPWASAQTLIPLFLGAAGILATLLWERWGATNPFIRPLVFKSRSAVAAYAGAIIQGLMLYGQFYNIPLYLESVQGLSLTMVGVHLFPISFAMLPAGAMVGILASRTGHFRWAVWSGWCVTILGGGLLILLDANTRPVSWLFIFVVAGLGHGMLLSAQNITAQATCSPQDSAFAAAMYAFMRGLGITLGVAIGGTVFENTLSSSLSNVGLPKEISQNATTYILKLRTLPVDSPLRLRLLQAYSKAFQRVFQVMTGIGLFGGFLSLLIGSHSMDKGLDSGHVLRRKDRDTHSVWSGYA